MKKGKITYEAKDGEDIPEAVIKFGEKLAKNKKHKRVCVYWDKLRGEWMGWCFTGVFTLGEGEVRKE
jgi:hypothetical protein